MGRSNYQMNFFAALSIYYSLLPLSKSFKLWNLMHKIPIWSKAFAMRYPTSNSDHASPNFWAIKNHLSHCSQLIKARNTSNAFSLLLDAFGTTFFQRKKSMQPSVCHSQTCYKTSLGLRWMSFEEWHFH